MNFTFSRSVRSRICALVSRGFEGVCLAIGLPSDSKPTFRGKLSSDPVFQERAQMKLLRVFGILVVLLGVLLAIAVAPSIYGPFDPELRAQSRPERRVRELSTLSGRGAEIGVSVRDVELAEADPQRPAAGVLVEDVRLDGPADKAGVKRSDVIVEFDGEHVRSARQFGRLVQETAPGRTVKAVVVRDGQRKELQITP